MFEIRGITNQGMGEATNCQVRVCFKSPTNEMRWWPKDLGVLSPWAALGNVEVAVPCMIDLGESQTNALEYVHENDISITLCYSDAITGEDITRDFTVHRWTEVKHDGSPDS